MKHLYSVNHVQELKQVSEKIISLFDKFRVFAFYGAMGAGKTTLIKNLCEQLEIVDPVSSPTFSLVNEYVDAQGNTFYHFDFYRIKEEQEAMDIGCEEYFYSGNPCFIEWPEKIRTLLPDDCVAIHIIAKGEQRKISIETN